MVLVTMLVSLMEMEKNYRDVIKLKSKFNKIIMIQQTDIIPRNTRVLHTKSKKLGY